MKLSVCIPTYNRPDLVLKAIESVLSQGFADFELLIHDNSENTLTENAIKQISDDRIKYFRHPNNVGIARNWNSLLEKASYKYVKFLNDDDQLLPECLSRIANAITELEKTHSEIGTLSCRARYVNENEKLIKLDKLGIGGETDYFVTPKNAAYLWCLSELRLRTPTQMVYNRIIAQNLGGFDEHLAYSRDVFLALKLAACAGAAILDAEPIVQFTFHSGQDGRGVPIKVRLDDQLKVTAWAYERMGSGHRIRKPKAILGEICLREFALMVRDKRIGDAFTALGTYFRRGVFSSFLCFLENNTGLLVKINDANKKQLFEPLVLDEKEAQ